MVELNSSDWFYYGEWQQPPFSAAFWVHWFDAGLVREMNLRELRGGFVLLDGHSIPLRADFEALTRRAGVAVEKKDAAFMASICGVSQRVFGEALSFSKKLGGWHDCDSVKLFEEFVAIEKKITCPWTVACILSDVLGDALAARAAAIGVNVGGVIARLPSKESIMLRQRAEALALKRELGLEGKTPALMEKIAEHVRAYEWIGTHHCWGEPFTVEKFFAELASLEEKPCDAAEAEGGGIPEELVFVANAANDAGFLRQYSAEVFNVVAYVARPLMNEIAGKWGLSYKEFTMMTPDEVIALLRSDAKPNALSLSERKKNGFCVFERAGREVVVSNEKELRALYAELAPQMKTPAANVKTLRGRGACPGKARGAVKIFLVPENLDKMKRGDVLVAPMTTPDFVPIMKRAAAIVTDNGGLLSHAAIVSRELGIPCVVGTRQATRVLRDGDVVEVNGETGVVNLF